MPCRAFLTATSSWIGAPQRNRVVARTASGSQSGSADDISRPLNPGTRAEATDMLRDSSARPRFDASGYWLDLDFTYGFPAGFAAALQLPYGAPPWRATWTHLTQCITTLPTTPTNDSTTLRS